MKKLALIFLAFLWLSPYLVFAQKAKWTVLVFMNADNDLEAHGIEDFLEMAQVPNSDLVNVLVQMDRTPGWTDEYGDWDQTLRFKISQGMTPTVVESLEDLKETNMGDPVVLRNFINWGKEKYPAEHYLLVIWDHGDGWRFADPMKFNDDFKFAYIKDFKREVIAANEVKFEMTSANKSNLSAQLQKLDLTEDKVREDLFATAKSFSVLPKELKAKTKKNENWTELYTNFRDFLNKSITTIPSAQLKIADSYSKLIDKLMNIDLSKNNLMSSLEEFHQPSQGVLDAMASSIQFDDVTNPVKGVSHDRTDNDFLYNKEIQDNILSSEFDILGYDACLMSMLETAYSLKGKCDFLIGSEDLEPGTGWNYAEWLSKLTANPDMAPVFLTKNIVESYRMTYAHFNKVTLSSVDMKLIPGLSEQLEVLSKLLISQINSEINNIKSARDNCLKYAVDKPQVHSIDLKRFVNQLSLKTKDQNIKEVCSRIKTIVEVMVVANFFSADRSNSDTKPSHGSFGIAIYFPSRKVYFDQAYNDDNTIYPVQFVKDFSWDNFLQKYFSLKP
ncbi:clostripain-related cysteine peptidase [Pedobacter foliorum]|uniref:clostripain-related cysteine peptidase n=1 Tax=Pedobacter foliorum TaxID=2739058 RepID=UPI0015634956|nr:clostripain-related cysteine peptidase [Pedobacter foliorum]NRF37406.1 hypothetical protein [Pedobacter foliorum]